jgi:hypothetical protein
MSKMWSFYLCIVARELVQNHETKRYEIQQIIISSAYIIKVLFTIQHTLHNTI